MKISNYPVLLVLIAVLGCSDNEKKVDQTSKIEFNINGVPADIDLLAYTSARKDGHHIHVGTNKENTSFLISFDENGHFGKIVCTYTEPVGSIEKKFTSPADFSSHYFNFQMVSHNAETKRVKVNFSGYVFRDPLNLSSEPKYVMGSFDMPYQYYVPTITNIINEATINGNYWRSTNRYQKRIYGSYDNIVLHTLSDDQYKIMIFFNDAIPSQTLPGTYSFSNSDVFNKVQIARYDVATSSYVFYDCTGTLVISAKWNYCLQGSYTLNGVNPNDPTDTINVQNGNFKLSYNP